MSDNMKETRPFCADQARAGAPYACRNGSPATILKWDAKGSEFQLLGFVDRFGIEMPENWKPSGHASNTNDPRDHDLVMLPLGEIDGRPVFVGDELEVKVTRDRINAKPENRRFDFCRWPVAKVYPATMINGEDLQEFVDKRKNIETTYAEDLRELANYVLRDAVDNGQVVPEEWFAEVLKERDRAVLTLQQARYTDEGGELWKPPLGPRPPSYDWQEPIDGFGIISGVKGVVQGVKQAVEGRAARDMAIAEAVRDTVKRWAAYGNDIRCEQFMRSLGLEAIIEQVK